MKTFLTTLAAGAILCAGAPSFAAAPASAPVQAAEAVVATPDPATVRAVQNLLQAMHYRELMQNMFSQAAAQAPSIARRNMMASIASNSRLSDEQRKEAVAKSERVIAESSAGMQALFGDPKLIDELILEIVPLYARHFSADEIDQMTAFYRTPVGAKMLASMPSIMAEMMQVSERLITPRMQTIQQQIQALIEKQ